MLDEDDRDENLMTTTFDSASVAADGFMVGRARAVRLADVQRTTVEWLWSQRIPRGAITILDGDPGLGKSTLMADIAARVTTGNVMPFANNRAEPGNVILMSAEDHIANTIKPRLEAAGADTQRVAAFVSVATPEDPDAMPTLASEDVAALEELIVDENASLVIVDPLAAYLPAGTDAHKDTDVRRVLRALAAMAQRTAVAIVIVRHLRKGEGPALYRGSGSIGIIGAARSGLLVAPGPNGTLYLAATKSNLGKKAPTVTWHLADAGEVARVEWGAIAEGVDADSLAVVTGGSSEVSKAADELEAILADGPVPANDATQQVIDRIRCSPATVRRAREQLGVVCTQERNPDGRAQRWIWKLREPAVDEMHDE
jgi:hypothetical protein